MCDFCEFTYIINLQKHYPYHYCRTDKGVSALKMVISLKLPPDEPTLVENVNSLLPADIRLHSVVRVTKVCVNVIFMSKVCILNLDCTLFFLLQNALIYFPDIDSRPFRIMCVSLSQKNPNLTLRFLQKC